MKKILLICTALCTLGTKASAQYLFPEQYEKTVPPFCLD